MAGYPTRNKEPEPIDEEGYTLRTKLKREFKTMGFAASVQTEADHNRWENILNHKSIMMTFLLESGFEFPT